MHPKYIVWLESEEGHIVQHELYFNENKARHAYRRASRPDKDGFYELVGENDSYSATLNVRAIMRFIGSNISTTKDRWRKSFLNLTGEEEEELAKRFQIPVEIIREISEIEKAIFENKSYFAHPYDEKTSAFVRKYVPNTLASILRKVL